jgi:16S rRNA (guanine527-N7)-methyltransferase
MRRANLMEPSAKQVLIDGVNDLGLDLTQDMIDSLLFYADEMLSWNQKINLTAISTPMDIVVKHLIDSLTCLCIPDIWSKAAKIIDVGTGAGLPGIPIKIVLPRVSVVYLDSIGKRLKFVESVLGSLNMNDYLILHNRAEDLSRQSGHKESYDMAISRAVAKLNTLCEYCLPFVKIDGYFVAMKGPSVDEEIANSERAYKILGAELVNDIKVSLPKEYGERRLLVFQKVKATPVQYPRKAGTPEKNPL